MYLNKWNTKINDAVFNLLRGGMEDLMDEDPFSLSQECLEIQTFL